MAIFCQGVLGQNVQFFVKMAFWYSYQLFSSNSKSEPQNIDPCAKFQPDWTKDKGSSNFDWNDTENCLTTSYLPHSDDVSKIIIDFDRFCSRVPSYKVWW